MAFLHKKQYFFSVVLLVFFCVVVFLFVSPAQVVRESIPPEETSVRSSFPNRAPVGYQVSARPVVTFPFTDVSADRLRLDNVQEVSEGGVRESTPIIVSPFPFFTNSRSPDGQWSLFYSAELISASLGNLSVTRVDGSGERNVLFTDMGYRDGFRTSIYHPRLPSVYRSPVVWSWDSNRLFYRLWRRSEDSMSSDFEGWVESVDVRTGETTRHTDISFYSDLYSYATARHPNDPVLFDDSPDYQLEGPRGIKTRDGSASWVIDGFYPLYLSPNKQMVLGYKEEDVEKEYGRQYLVYTVDGAGPLYIFQVDGYLHGHLSAPVWSPDSSKLVYQYVTERADDTGLPAASDLYLMNIDGTGRTNLTNTPDIPDYFRGWTVDGRFFFHVFDVSVGGQYIADLVEK